MWSARDYTLLLIVASAFIVHGTRAEFEDGPEATETQELPPLTFVRSDVPMSAGCRSLRNAFAPLPGETPSIDGRQAEDANFDLNNKEPNDRSILGKVRPWSGGAKGVSKIRVFCGTYTHHKKHLQASMMRRVWGVRCDRHILFTDKPDDSPLAFIPKEDIVHLKPRGGESYENMWQKSREMFMYLTMQSWVYDYDFFFFGGDDAFVIPENLRRLATEPDVTMLHEAGAPIFFGYRQRPPAYDRNKKALPTPDERFAKAFVSGAGYVLNLNALLIGGSLVRYSPQCSPDLNAFHEDVTFADCLATAGIHSRDARDAFGQDRFIILSHLHMHYQVRDADYSWWWRDYRDRGMPSGLDIVSESTVLFHFIDPRLLVQVAQAIYGMSSNEVYGVK